MDQPALEPRVGSRVTADKDSDLIAEITGQPVETVGQE